MAWLEGTTEQRKYRRSDAFTVLLADHSDRNRQLIRELLENEMETIILEADTGRSVKTHLGLHEHSDLRILPDLLLLRDRYPDCAGKDLLKDIGSRDWHREVTVFLLGNGSESSGSYCKQHRVIDDRLSVPVEPNTLKHRIQSVLMSTDVLRQKQSKINSKQRFEDQLDRLVKTSRIPMAIVNQLGVVKLWNPGMEDLYGFDKQEAEGRFHPAVPDDQRVDFYSMLSGIIDGQDLATGVEVERRTADDERLIVRKGGIALGDAPKDRQVLLFDRDVSEQAQQREDLNKFLQMMAHDISTPIQNIQSAINLMKNNLKENEPDRLRQNLSLLEEAHGNLCNLMNGLKKLFRMEASSLDFQALDLQDLVSDVLSMLHYKIESKGADVSCDDLSRCTADPDLIAQLYQNLIENALKFASKEHPVIRLTEELNGDQIILGVWDNGPGVPDDARDDLFEPMKTHHSQEEGSNTGIGLSICRRIVQKHDGSIWYEEGDDGGAHFRFSLPRHPVPTEHSAYAEERPGQATSGNNQSSDVS